jgi:hypothetical protein
MFKHEFDLASWPGIIMIPIEVKEGNKKEF